MAPYATEWRYGFAGECMPWYPSVRLVRQSAFGGWDGVAATAAERLVERRAARTVTWNP
jgi:hypothetical protein